MKIVLPGGSGQLGSVLARAFHGEDHDVVVLSRRLRPAPWRVVEWDGSTLASWSREVDGAHVVINLAGRSVNCRYKAANRKEMMDSRLDSTRAVGEAIANASRPPRVWLQMSTATIYSHRYDAANDEASGILGGQEADAPDSWRFSIDIARAWEQTLDAAPTPATRKVALRSAVTMSPDAGGAFDLLMRLVKRGLGGRAGDGRQFVSWIHADDFVQAVRWLIDHDEVSGVINVASPNPLPNAEFMRTLRAVSGTAIGLPAARWMLEIGAVLLRTETELILKSRRVVPTRLLERGFTFRFPRWEEAATDLFQRWQATKASIPT
ncbi:MAG TPA: TIGR01777 family oxidoreductase [Thermoanaerobaculia bacterium]